MSRIPETDRIEWFLSRISLVLIWCAVGVMLGVLIFGSDDSPVASRITAALALPLLTFLSLGVTALIYPKVAWAKRYRAWAIRVFERLDGVKK